MADAVDFLNSPLAESLLRIHPNDVSSPQFTVPGAWSCWWDWAVDGKWQSLVEYYGDGQPRNNIPQELVLLIDRISSLQLGRSPPPRTPCFSGSRSCVGHVLGDQFSGPNGMSPKKAHEVNQMSTFVGSMLQTLDLSHVVDIGAGQGYLSRSLHARYKLHVLALDSDDLQTSGAQRRGRKSKVAQDSGSITYKTAHITSTSLQDAINDWITTPLQTHPTPVLLVALHACGSLTPAIFRSFLSSSSTSNYVIRGAVIVGCCYNLLDASDFPLSHALRCRSPRPQLSPQHLQLAAQVPATWLLTDKARQRAALSIKKVAWRALLQGLTESAVNVPSGRLGRLSDKAYDDWETFVGAAGEKLSIVDEIRLVDADQEKRRALEARLQVLHVLRCLLGPVVESLVIMDRVEWLRDALVTGKETMRMEVQLVNLFDQATGSGRNVAIVISPSF